MIADQARNPVIVKTTLTPDTLKNLMILSDFSYPTIKSFPFKIISHISLMPISKSIHDWPVDLNIVKNK